MGRRNRKKRTGKRATTKMMMVRRKKSRVQSRNVIWKSTLDVIFPTSLEDKGSFRHKQQNSSENGSNRLLHCWSQVYKNLARFWIPVGMADTDLRVWPQCFLLWIDSKLLSTSSTGVSSTSVTGSTTREGGRKHVQACQTDVSPSRQTRPGNPSYEH